MLFKKLHKLEEEDFAIFRASFESGRQTPKNLRKAIFILILMQVVIGIGVYAAAGPSMRPEYYKATLLIVQYILTLILLIYSMIYTIPTIYMKRQHIQFLVASLSLFNFFGIFPYYGGLFMLVRTVEITERSFFNLALFILVTGVILFIIIIFRLQRLLQAGIFGRDSKKYNYEEVLKKDRAILSKLPKVMIAGIGIMFTIQIVLLKSFDADTETIMIVLIGIALFYYAIIQFANATIVTYCKKRFASFNFDEDGNLYPLGSGDKEKGRK